MPQKNGKNPEPQKTNYFVFVLLFVGVVFLYYNVFKKDSTGETAYSSLSYSPVAEENLLINIELKNKRAFNVSVRIYKKLRNDQLEAIARKVKSDINEVSENGVVFFLLPEMKDANGAWAAVDFNPDVKVRVIGKSIEDEQNIRAGLENITDYVGLWIDNGLPGDVLMRIRKDKVQGYVFEYISSSDPGPSDLAKPLKRIEKSGKSIFRDLDNLDQYYMLEDNGDLSAHDNYGFISRYVKLK